MRKKLDEILGKNDAVILTSPHSIRYFSGFSGGEGAVLITRENCFLFTDSRYIEQAQGEAKGFSVIETNYSLKEVADVLKKENMRTVVFENDFLSVSEYKKIQDMLDSCELVFGSMDIHKIRMVKEEEELEKIRNAEHISCRAFEHIVGYIKPGVYETDIALEMEYFMRKNGAEDIAFDTIAISGARTSLPHGVPSTKMIETGDFVTLDFGCKIGGYCSDMTRTVVVGKASEEQRKIYETVKTAQQMGLEAICDGVKCSDADRLVRAYIEEQGYGQYFRHSLGHGVGLLVHELPNLSPRSEFILCENMVVSCEPGIYIPGFGGVRIEDLVVVKKDGCENLTYATKELMEIY